jgi:hypothetical protein
MRLEILEYAEALRLELGGADLENLLSHQPVPGWTSKAVIPDDHIVAGAGPVKRLMISGQVGICDVATPDVEMAR